MPRAVGEPDGLDRVGRYLLTDRLSSGGMADVWRARVTGIRGFTKTVAIKRLHPHLLERTRFVRMFSDEAKIASRLAHPNIVQIYDLGEDEGLPYIAMEYVAGRDLYQLMYKTAEGGGRLPWGLATRVAADILAGLHHAHDFRSFDGLPQEIVHRDVSPRNVLVAWGGEVKLTDFGVARARDREEHTEHGVIKGKVRYISPEAAAGRTVDRRSDLFSLGVVLAEMLTMAPLRQGSNDLQMLLEIRDGAVDPRRFDSLPPGLRDLVLRALSRDPDDRYPTAAAFRADLLERATGDAEPFPTAAVGRYMESLFTDAITAEERRELEIDARLAAEAVRPVRSSTTDHPLNVVSSVLPRSVAARPASEPSPRRPPDMAGMLRESSLTALFHRIAATRRPTELRLSRPPLVKTVYFADGHPAFVESNLEHELLGEHLVAKGVLNRERHSEILDHAARHGLRFIEALLAVESMPPHQLFRLLAEQVRERILEVFTWLDGRWERFDGESPPDGGMPLALRTHALIHEGIQDRAPLALIRRSHGFDRHDRVERLGEVLPTDLQLSGRQQRLLRLLEPDPVTVGELIEAEPDRERVYRLLYMLSEIGHLRIG